MMASKAKQDQAQEFRNYPSDYMAVVKQAFSLMHRYEWPHFKYRHERLHSTDTLVTSRRAPVAQTAVYSDGSSLIKINEGLVLHLKAISGALLAGARFEDDDHIEPAVLSPDAVTDLIRRINEQWIEREQLKKVEPIPIPPVGPIAAEVTENTFLAALLFTVLHEYGHAAHGHTPDHDPQIREIEADRWAAHALLEAAVALRKQPNYLLGGALLSILALSSREKIGKADLHGYPPSDKRFLILTEVVKTHPAFESELIFYIRTTSAFAHAMRLQSAEYDLGTDIPQPPSLPQHCVSLIISLLVEVQKGRKSLEAAIAEIQVGLARPEGPVLTQAAEICRRMFAPEACVGPLADMAREVAGLFHEIAPHLPQRS